MKIGYFADGVWAHQAVHGILSNSQIIISFICLRYEQPDSYLISIADTHNIPCFIERNVNDDLFVSVLKEYSCDLFVSMSFNQIFGSSIRNIVPLGTVNCHAGRLPYYRGRNILNWALINDEKEFGITVHYVDDGIDTGDVILQRCYPITDNDDYASLLTRSYIYCADVLLEVLDLFIRRQVTSWKQDTVDECGLYCSIRKPGDEIINWNTTSREIFNFVRALTEPGPCARTQLKNSEVKIMKLTYLPNAPVYKGIPGAILAKKGEKYLVKTKDSYVSIDHFTCENPLRVGDRFK